MADAASERKSLRAFEERMNTVIDPATDDVAVGKWRRGASYVASSPPVLATVTFALVLAMLFAVKPPIVMRESEDPLERPRFSWSVASIYAGVAALVVLAVPYSVPIFEKVRERMQKGKGPKAEE